MNGVWDFGERYTPRYRPAYSGATPDYSAVALRSFIPFRWTWLIVGQATVTEEYLLRFPQRSERTHDSEEAARDACIAWVTRACMRSKEFEEAWLR